MTSSEISSNYLSNVPEERRFWCRDGNILNNLEELRSALKNMSNETYIWHVNSERNDFSNWINDIIGDSELARSIGKSKTKTEMARKLSMRIKELRSA